MNSKSIERSLLLTLGIIAIAGCQSNGVSGSNGAPKCKMEDGQIVSCEKCNPYGDCLPVMVNGSPR